MTTENQEKPKYFLSVKKTTIYLSIALLGLIFLLIDFPGNIFMLVGLGLFYGHCFYRTIKQNGKTFLKFFALILTTLVISVHIILKYDPTRATTIILFFSLVSILIDWKRKNFILQKIGLFVLLLLITSATMYFLSDDVDFSENDSVRDHILIHHTKPSIKNEACIQVFDSATTLMETGNFLSALKLLQKCDEMEPNNATILNVLGISHFANGDSATALKYYFRAIEIDSTKPEAYASAGFLLDLLNKQNDAVKILKIGYSKTNLDQFTHYNICSNLSIAYFHIDSCEQAIKYITIAKRHGFNDPKFDKHIQQVEKEILNSCK